MRCKIRLFAVIGMLLSGASAQGQLSGEPTTRPGLNAQWTWGTNHASSLGQVDWENSSQVTEVAQIDWPSTRGAMLEGAASDYFALRLTGLIEIPTAGQWTFSLGSDDAAGLWIDGQAVVLDATPHSFRFRDGAVVLGAGSHTIEVRYLERSWLAGLQLRWAGPGVWPSEIVPGNAFTHSTVTADPVAQGGLRAFWTAGVNHATQTGQVDWNHYTSSSIVDNVSWPITRGAFENGQPSDYFSVRLMGSIEIPSTGSWTFGLGTEDAGQLLIDGQVVIDDGDSHTFRWRSGSVQLAAGSHTIEVRYLERSWVAGATLTWKGPGDAIESVVPRSALTPAQVAAGSSPVAGGMTAYWINGVNHASSLGQVDWDRYDSTSQVDNVSFLITRGPFQTGGPSDYFAVRLVGTLQVPTAGAWRFNLGSEDAAELIIDGRSVVYDGSSHTYRWRDGTITLAEGAHEIEVRFLERSWVAGLHLTWQGPGMSREAIIPPGALAPRALDAPPSDGTTGLRAYWTAGVNHATNLGQIDWNAFTSTTIEDRVNWRITRGAFGTGLPSDYFAVRMIGTITIPSGGEWTFGLGTEDAGALIIDGREIIDDGAIHRFRWQRQAIHLDAGEHTIEVRYFERSWVAGLMLTWQGPTVPREEVIPSAALTPGVMTPDSGLGLRAYWTTGTNHAVNIGQIDWDDFTSTTTGHNVAWRITRGAFATGLPSDYFAVRLLGTIDIPRTGDWSFNLGSEDAAVLLIDGQEVVEDGTVHTYRWRSGQVHLAAGKHQIEIRYMERSWVAGLNLTWQGPGDTHESIVPISALAPDTSVQIGGGTGGLMAYWTSGVNHATSLGLVDWDHHDTTSTESNISYRITRGAFATGKPSDYFALQLVGDLTVPASGIWSFNLGSEDAAELIIDGQLVVHDDQVHSYRWRNGQVMLAAGVHQIEVRYLERSWVAGLFLTWQGPGMTREQVIPASALTPRALEAPQGGGLMASIMAVPSSTTSIAAVNWDQAMSQARLPVDNVAWKITRSSFFPGQRSDYFAMRVTGRLEVPTTGAWTFWLGSDDAAQVLIDGQEVVSDPSTHSFRWQTATTNLTAGTHRIEVRYLERSWVAGLVLAWKGPGDAHEHIISPDAFITQRGQRRRVFSWGEIGADEMNMVRQNIPLGLRGNAARRAGRMNITRLIARLRASGADEATIQRILTGVDQ